MLRTYVHKPDINFATDAKMLIVALANKTAQYFSALRCMERHGYETPEPFSKVGNWERADLEHQILWLEEQHNPASHGLFCGSYTLARFDHILNYIAKYLHQQGRVSALFDKANDYFYICQACYSTTDFLAPLTNPALNSINDTLQTLCQLFPVWHKDLNSGNSSILVFEAPFEQVQATLLERYPYLHFEIHGSKAAYREEDQSGFHLLDEFGKVCYLYARDLPPLSVEQEVQNYYRIKKLNLLLDNGNDD